MNARRLIAVVLVATLSSGCHLRLPDAPPFNHDAYLDIVARDVNYSDVATAPMNGTPFVDDLGLGRLPNSLANSEAKEPWPITLEDAIQTALMNSQVLRDFGGAVLTRPTTVPTVYDPAIVETDPRFGVEAALSEFDAQVSVLKRFLNNDRAINNELIGGGTRLLKQDLHAYRTQLSKQTATGTQFFLRHNTDYDANNQPNNLFTSAWTTIVEGEFRHPLLQGAGTTFNRIAGPNATPGQLNGVVIARLNTDVSLAEFETAMRDFVSDVENAYWELYYTYRELDVKKDARDAALTSWRIVEAKQKLEGGSRDREAQAREQYYRFQEDVKNALSGRVLPRSASRLGIAPNLFAAPSGVYVAERNLRLLMGLPTNDSRLLQPTADPCLVRFIFDWNEIAAEALIKRPELKRQRALVKRSELQLMAAKNFLQPRLDAVGAYRFRGFGDDLINSNSGQPRFDNAFADLTSGDFQEWELGVELSFPVGFRRAHSAVRNRELLLARSKSLLREQERMVIHDLSNAKAELERSWDIVQTSMNRLAAAKEQLDVLENNRDVLKIPVDLNLILDAQRRKADAGRGYFRALAEYALALKNLHYTKGSLMEYNNVYFSDSVATPEEVPAPTNPPMPPNVPAPNGSGGPAPGGALPGGQTPGGQTPGPQPMGPRNGPEMLPAPNRPSTASVGPHAVMRTPRL